MTALFGGVTLTIFMYYWIDSENYSCTIDYPLGNICAFMQIFMPYWNFEYTKAVTLHHVKVEGSIYPGTEVTNLG